MGIKKKEETEEKETIISALEEERRKYLDKKKQTKKATEFDMMNMLNSFTSQLRKTNTVMGKEINKVDSKQEEEKEVESEDPKNIDPGN
jgi:hypothetical protein